MGFIGVYILVVQLEDLTLGLEAIARVNIMARIICDLLLTPLSKE